MKILFRLRKNPKDLSAPAYLYCRITVNGERAEPDFSTFIRILPAKWDSKAQRIRGNSEAAENDNRTLDAIRNQIREIYNRLLDGKKPLSARIIKDVYTGKAKENMSLLQVYQQYIEAKSKLVGKGIEPRTVETYQTRYNSLLAYLASLKRVDILPAEISIGFADTYAFHLRTVAGCGQDYALKNIQALKHILKQAVKAGLIVANPLEYFEFHFDRSKPIVFLQLDEVAALEASRLAQLRLQQVAHVFLFCCYTGLAYAEVRRFCYDQHVVKGQNGRQWIYMDRLKTHRHFSVPLLAKARELLASYNNRLPVISNAKMNSYLKEVAHVLGIPKKLTTHVARKTCGMLLLNGGMPIESVSKFLGHARINTTQRWYADVLPEKLGLDTDRYEKQGG